jgi:hypothetical protein
MLASQRPAIPDPPDVIKNLLDIAETRGMGRLIAFDDLQRA